MASTQCERKFVREQQNLPGPRKRNLDNKFKQFEISSSFPISDQNRVDCLKISLLKKIVLTI